MSPDPRLREAARKAAHAIARQQGRAMAVVIEHVYRGDIEKGLAHAQWTEPQKKLVRATDRILLSGTIGLSDPLGSLMKEAAEQEIARRYPNLQFQFVRVVQSSGTAAAQGAFLLLPSALVCELLEVLSPSRTRGVLLADIGGTKTHLEIAEVRGDGNLRRAGTALLELEFPTPKAPPTSALYAETARQMRALAQEASRRGIQVISTGAVAFAAAFERGDGGVTWDGQARVAEGFGFNLGPGIPGSCPAKELAERLPGFSFRIFTDGVAQFRFAMEAASADPSLRRLLSGKKLMLLAPGTGIGAGFGEISAAGEPMVYPVTHVSDLVAPEFQAGITFDWDLPDGPLQVTVPTPRPTWARDVLGGKAIERIIATVDEALLAAHRAPLFLPFCLDHGWPGTALHDRGCAGMPTLPLDARFLNERIFASPAQSNITIHSPTAFYR